MQVTITYDPDTETLSVDPTAYAGTTADNDTSELIIEGLVGDFVDWTVDLVFPIVSFSSSCNSFYPMARLDQTRIYSLPNALLSLCRDGILPVQLRLTRDERIKWSRNTVRIDVSKIVDAVGAIGDTFPLQAYLKGDSASWSRSIVYEEGAIVEMDGYLYRSTDSNNLGNDPEIPGSTWWSPIGGGGAAPYYSGLFGDGEQTAIDVRHGLNTEELAWSIYLDGSYTEDVIVTVIDADNVRLSFDHTPSYNSVHVVIMPAFRVVGHGIRIKGPLLVEGDITNMGGAHIIYTDEMHTKMATIYLREDATIGLLPGELSGLRFVKYDGVHDGILAVDSHGTAYVGDEGDLQPIATRADADEMTDDLPVVWDADNTKLVTRQLTKSDVGLDNVSNLSPADLGISTATQTALDGKVSKTGDTMTGVLHINTDTQYPLRITTGTTYPFSIWDRTTNARIFTLYKPSNATTPFLQMSGANGTHRWDIGEEGTVYRGIHQLSSDPPVDDNSGSLSSCRWVNSRLTTKQNVLTFDSTPTTGSANPVTSGGIKTAIDAIQGATLYEHDIKVVHPAEGDHFEFSLTVLNQSATPFTTLQTLWDYLGSEADDFKHCSGTGRDGTNELLDLTGVRGGLANQFAFNGIYKATGVPVTFGVTWTVVTMYITDRVRQIV